MLHVQDYDGRTPGSRDADGRGQVEERSQERRKHVFAINASPPFLNIIRELFQEEGYNVTTTNFAPNSFAQIEALHRDALIIDIAIGQEARMPISPASRHLWSRPIPGCRVRGSSRAVNACRLSQLRSAVS